MCKWIAFMTDWTAINTQFHYEDQCYGLDQCTSHSLNQSYISTIESIITQFSVLYFYAIITLY
jgi:hypothetical protein